MLFRSKRRTFRGELALMFGIWNGTGRVFIEGLRTDSLMLGGIRISQLLAGIAVIICLYCWIHFKKKYTAIGSNITENRIASEDKTEAEDNN